MPGFLPGVTPRWRGVSSVRKDQFAGRTTIAEDRSDGVLNFFWIILTAESLVHFLHKKGLIYRIHMMLSQQIAEGQGGRADNLSVTGNVCQNDPRKQTLGTDS
jgi:hypothetical protein